MVMQSVVYGESRFHYQVCFVPTLKNRISIHVHPDGKVQVDAPDKSDLAAIKKAVLKRARWVLGHIQNSREQREHVRPREYVSGESYFYLGRRHMLKVSKVKEGGAVVKLSRGKFQVDTQDTSPEAVKTALWAWYRDHARQYFIARLEVVCGQVPWVSQVPEWRLRTMRRQWGSCSSKGILTLNPHLVKAPRECIDYVLLHELCHLREHNHSKKFYALLSKQVPEWKAIKGKLDAMSELLLNE